jgi:hypothetical protein
VSSFELFITLAVAMASERDASGGIYSRPRHWTGSSECEVKLRVLHS